MRRIGGGWGWRRGAGFSIFIRLCSLDRVDIISLGLQE